MPFVEKPGTSVGGSRPGHATENPMAIVAPGGLFPSILLNLLFMPALYRMFAKPKQWGDAENRAG